MKNDYDPMKHWLNGLITGILCAIIAIVFAWTVFGTFTF